MEENITVMSLMHFVLSMESRGSLQLLILLSKMMLLKGKIGQSWRWLGVCWVIFLASYGEKP